MILNGTWKYIVDGLRSPDIYRAQYLFIITPDDDTFPIDMYDTPLPNIKAFLLRTHHPTDLCHFNLPEATFLGIECHDVHEPMLEQEVELLLSVDSESMDRLSVFQPEQVNIMLGMKDETLVRFVDLFSSRLQKLVVRLCGPYTNYGNELFLHLHMTATCGGHRLPLYMPHLTKLTIDIGGMKLATDEAVGTMKHMVETLNTWRAKFPRSQFLCRLTKKPL
jgi:hypothetical protein